MCLQCKPEAIYSQLYFFFQAASDGFFLRLRYYLEIYTLTEIQTVTKQHWKWKIKKKKVLTSYLKTRKIKDQMLYFPLMTWEHDYFNPLLRRWEEQIKICLCFETAADSAPFKPFVTQDFKANCLKLTKKP